MSESKSNGAKLHVVLVPGFFGFGSLGALDYFHFVDDYLAHRLGELGLHAEVTHAPVPPTASLRTRSAAVARHINSISSDGDRIALIGHSSGGLDARLVASPSVDLQLDFELEPLGQRIESVVTVASPHRGTPMAELFFGMIGQRVLRVLSLLTVALIRGASLPMGVLAKIGATLARVRLPGGKTEALLEALYDELLGIFPSDEKDSIAYFVAEVGNDQALVSQITPSAIDVFNAGAAPRVGVRYGCVVCAAPKPTWRTQASLPKRPTVQAGYLVYRWLTSAMQDEKLQEIDWHHDQKAVLESAFGQLPEFYWSDAIVPTLSQIYGEVLWAGHGDHLDVIGHFDGPDLEPPHTDWLMTGAGFSGSDFEKLWSAVVEFVAGTRVSQSGGTASPLTSA